MTDQSTVLPPPDPPRAGAAPSSVALLVAALGSLAVVAAVIAIALSRPAPPLLSTNSRVTISGRVILIDPGQTRCQHDEIVLGDTRLVRLYGGPDGAGPAFRFAVQDASGATVASADVADGWTTTPLDVPLQPPATVDPAVVCITNKGTKPAVFAGNLTPPGLGYDKPRYDSKGNVVSDDVRIDYRTDEPGSYLSRVGEAARRFALYKPGPFGAALFWIVIGGAIAIALAAVAVTAVWARDGFRGRVRWALIACAVIGTGHAWAWALTTPPFQIPDEAVHVSYTDYLAYHGRLPPIIEVPRTAPFSTTIYALPYDALWNGMPFTFTFPINPSARTEQAVVRQSNAAPDDAVVEGPGTAAGYPPLYYGYEAIADRAAASLTPLDRIYALRLWSGLLLGITVAGVFVFLRELMPSRPWTWTVGALAVALQPMAAFVSGGVNNDVMVYALAAWMFALVARCFRLGVTRARAVAIGLLAAASLMTKPTAAGILPGIGLGLLLAARRGGRRQLPRAFEGAAAGGAALAAWIAAAVAFGHRSLLQATGFGGGTEISSEGAKSTLIGQLKYLWQYYLPRLPGMGPGLPADIGYPLYDVWFRGFVGLLGWAAYPAPDVVQRVGLGVVLGVAALALVGLVRARQQLRDRIGELASYALAAVGLVGFIAYIGYHLFAAHKASFEQTRYLFPLMALYGAVVAAAVSGLGRRWGPVFGVALVTAMGAHSIISLLLSVRYYSV